MLIPIDKNASSAPHTYTCPSLRHDFQIVAVAGPEACARPQTPPNCEMPNLLLVPVCACPKSHVSFETLTLYSSSFPNQPPRVTVTLHFISKQISDKSCDILYTRGHRLHARMSRFRASGDAVPLRAPALPNTPPRRTRTRTRDSLPGASAFILATHVGTQAPPPPGASRKLPAGSRVHGSGHPWMCWGLVSGREDSEGGERRSVARRRARPGDHGGAAAFSPAAGTVVEPATARGGS